ncbi:hypothetical protein CEXT_246741, partial [Caerostris extrusa]
MLFNANEGRESISDFCVNAAFPAHIKGFELLETLTIKEIGRIGGKDCSPVNFGRD